MGRWNSLRQWSGRGGSEAAEARLIGKKSGVGGRSTRSHHTTGAYNVKTHGLSEK